MRTMKLAERLFTRLHEMGVEYAFGVPGDFALNLYDALAQSPVKPIVMTHEPCAGFAADAYARVKGIGTAVVTYGVGALNLVNPVAQAYAEKSPLVVISGGPGVRERREHDLLHHKVKTFESQLKVFQEVTAASAVLDNPIVADAEIARVLGVATTFKRPVYIEVPRDMVQQEIELSDTPAPPAKQVSRGALVEAVQEAVAMLNKARRPVILADVETHRFGLQAEVKELAEHLRVPVASTLLGKSAFPEGHPLYVGIYMGHVGDPYVRDIVEGSDALLMLGAFLTDINMGLWTAQIEPENTILATSERILVRHHQYANVDFGDFVRSLVDAADLTPRDAAGIRPMQPKVQRSQGAITTEGVLAELNDFLNEKTVLVSDVGDAMFAAQDIRSCEGAGFLCPAYYASMGFSVPGSIGAQLADPTRRIVILVGDGAFQMTGMELTTIARLGLKPTVIVLNNGTYGSLQAFHGPAPMLDIGRWDYAALAGVLGGRGYVVTTGDELAWALQDAQQQDRFRLLDVRLEQGAISPALERVRLAFSKTLKG